MQSKFALSGENFEIKSWDELKNLPRSAHDECYISILEQYKFLSRCIPVPLKGRYTKGRRWTEVEFEECFGAWKKGVSLTLIAANLNRNPQDMIYKLLDRCKEEGIQFTQRGRTESTKNWNKNVKECAERLFEEGLPAWKIAVLFQVEFEHVEKELFVNRRGYGHEKKNPFTINTDHKQYVNEQIIQSIERSKLKALEPFAGEGRFTKILLDSDSIDSVTCIESDERAFKELSKNIKAKNAALLFMDNMEFFSNKNREYFDLIDLDPFVTCHEQLKIVWNFMADEAYLFVTFGGEYRRSFIRTNRKSIFERYGFIDEKAENSEYLEKIPYYFLGFVASQACLHGYSFEVLRAVRYANNCRYWLKAKRNRKSKGWLAKNTTNDKYGILFENLEIPRFKEVRKEIDDAKKLGFSR